jgi:hypothetical protein
MRATIPVLLASGAALALSAAPVGAATLTADQPCYVEGQRIGLVGQGFGPAAPITITGDGVFLSGPAGADGAFSAGVKAPPLGTTNPASRTVRINAADNAGVQAIADVQVATGAFSTSTGVRSPRAVRTWKFSGLFQRPGRPIYGHFRHKGRTYANYRFGVPTGPCGTLTKRAPGIPARRVPAGSWTVQVDFSPTYDRNATPRLTGTTTVFTTFRPRR